jgi:hypothetical protein
MVTVKVTQVNTIVLEALIDVIRKHHDVNIKYHKPSLSRTAEIQLEGKGAEGFLEDLKSFCSQVGWKIELL